MRGMTEPPRTPFQCYVIACRACPRRGRYSKTSLGPLMETELELGEKALAIARWRGCPRAIAMSASTPLWERCGAYVDLAAMWRADKLAEEARRRGR